MNIIITIIICAILGSIPTILATYLCNKYNVSEKTRFISVMIGLLIGLVIVIILNLIAIKIFF